LSLEVWEETRREDNDLRPQPENAQFILLGGIKVLSRWWGNRLIASNKQFKVYTSVICRVQCVKGVKESSEIGKIPPKSQFLAREASKVVRKE
jgi:hypothetical protein